jgi:hypothetical protein
MNTTVVTPRSRVAPVLAVLAALAVAVPRVAAAQATPQDQAVAQSLYDEAKKLMAADKWSDACPKLEESQRLDPTPVTEFYLADCYERAGRTASAWTTFLDLAASEHKNGGAKAAEREKVARDRASALEPKLSQLVIDVPAAARVAGLVVKRDGEVVREGQWGTKVAVDPGRHVVEASAPGKKSWTASQDVQGAGSSTTVSVEVLQDAPADVVPPPVTGGTSAIAPATPPPAADTTSSSSPLKTVGLVTGGVGVAGLVVGGIFGAMALSKNSSANSGHCGGSLGGANQCDSTGVSLRSDAVNFGNISTIAFIAGGVLAAGGATLFLVAPSGHVQASPAVGSSGGGVIVRGDF